MLSCYKSRTGFEAKFLNHKKNNDTFFLCVCVCLWGGGGGGDKSLHGLMINVLEKST